MIHVFYTLDFALWFFFFGAGAALMGLAVFLAQSIIADLHHEKREQFNEIFKRRLKRNFYAGSRWKIR